MTLANAELGVEYLVNSIDIDDEQMLSFLFSLGCYAGEPITIISRTSANCVVAIKDARYSIDMDLARAIAV